jgi:hypothetical chaperone protein
MTNGIGIDFGTTNSSIARVNSAGGVELARYEFQGAVTDAYRSLLYLEQHREHGRLAVKSWSGPQGVEQYLASESKGRLIQSLKSFLSSRSFKTTEVFGRSRTLEELIARILEDLRHSAERQFGVPIRTATVGRPVRFVASESEADDDFALARLRHAFQLAGFDQVRFEFEPVAAAHWYESTLDHEELILVGDFGGGTSDFSLIRGGRILGNAGVGLAGDAFDAKIIRHVVSPALGAGTHWRSLGKVLPVPKWIYASLERWHHLSFLKTKDVTSTLHSVRAQADEPEKIQALIELVREDLGYPLHRSVQTTKCVLSSSDRADFHFADLHATVERADFERWIAEELDSIAGCVDRLLSSVNTQPGSVDAVFLTGGTSFVPAVRRLFASRFGDGRIRSGNEFTSVARGLALRAAQ